MTFQCDVRKLRFDLENEKSVFPGSNQSEKNRNKRAIEQTAMSKFFSQNMKNFRPDKTKWQMAIYVQSVVPLL